MVVVAVEAVGLDQLQAENQLGGECRTMTSCWPLAGGGGQMLAGYLRLVGDSCWLATCTQWCRVTEQLLAGCLHTVVESNWAAAGWLLAHSGGE